MGARQLGKVHKVLRLPRNLHFKVHKVLRLPRTLHFKVRKILQLPRNLHFKVHKVLRLPRNLHFQVHKVPRICTLRSTKCCACHGIGTSRSTKHSGCHEICTSRTCDEICTSRSTKIFAPATISDVQKIPKVTIHCTCHIRARRRPPPCPKYSKYCACHKVCQTAPILHEVDFIMKSDHQVQSCSRHHNESAPPSSTVPRPAFHTTLRREIAFEDLRTDLFCEPAQPKRTRSESVP